MKKNKIIFLIFAVLFIFAPLVSTAFVETNVISNPGFENGDTKLLNWNLVTNNNNIPIWDMASHNGSRSIKISVPGTNTVPRSGYVISSSFIPVLPSEHYTFSAWGKTSGIAGNAIVYLAEVGDINSISEHAIFFSSGTQNWTKKETGFTTLPGTTSLYIVSRIESGHGDFWLDDLELTLKLPKPSITIDSPSNDDVFSTPIIAVNGSTTGKSVISEVKIKVGSGEWQTASGTTSWNTSVNLTSGLNTIFVNATDVRGNFNETSVTVTYTPSFTQFTNLISNPGFENGDTKPMNWALVTNNNNIPIWDTDSYNGSRSIKISVPGINTIHRSGYVVSSSFISVSPSETYTFSAWGKTSGLEGNAVVYLAEVGDINSISEHAIFFSSGTQNWTKKETGFTTLPGTTSLYIVSRIESGHGDFWLDDLELTLKLPKPSIAIDSPLNDETFSTPIIAVNGSATGESLISEVKIKVGSGEWQTASGTTFWNTSVNLTSGLNTIFVNATDVLGNFNETSVTVTYTPLYIPLPTINLISNPGFENGDTKLLNWNLVTNNNNIPIWDTDSYNGSRSIKISVPGTNTVPRSGYVISSSFIPVLPSEHYTFSAWGKTSGIAGNAIVYLAEAGDMHLISEHPILFSNETQNWTKKEISFTTLPGTTLLYMVSRIESGYGDFWLDDLELTLSPPKPSITIDSPSNDEVFSTRNIAVNGTATGENVISEIKIKVGSGDWKTASGTTSWNTSVNLTSGLNTIYVNVTDVLGNFNETSVTVTYIPLSNINLISNPGFENGDTKLLNWTFVTNNNNIPKWDTDSYNGSRSIKISVPGTNTIARSGYVISSSNIAVSPSEKYTFSAWGKTSGLAGNAVVFLAEAGDINSIAEHTIFFINATQNWTRKEISFTTLPGTSSINIVSRIESGYGDFWLDDLELIITPSKPSITIDSPPNDEVFSIQNIAVNGTATGENDISEVKIKVGSGEWQIASGTTSWNTIVNLTSGLNTIYVRATDVLGNFNETSVMVTYTPLFTPLPNINLISNPGFENDDTKLLNWTLVTSNTNTPKWDTESYNGSRSIKISVLGTIPMKESGYVISSPHIDALPSEQYTFSAWGKTYGLEGTGVIYIVEEDTKLNYSTEHAIGFNKGTENWIKKEINFTTRPETRSLYIVSKIEYGFGNFWLDDFELRLINTPTPIITPTPTPTITPTPIITPTPTGKEYYVAKNGNDNNPGAENSPFLTIQKAANTAVAGETVYVKAGTYMERIVVSNSGSPGNYITFQNYPGDLVKISLSADTAGTILLGKINGNFEINDKSYIKVKGFTFITPYVEGIGTSITAQLGSHHVIIDGNVFDNISNAAIYNGYFRGNSGDEFAAWNIDVINNRVHRAGTASSPGGYQELVSHDRVGYGNISYNKITNQRMGECITYKQGSKHGIISYNTISNCYSSTGQAIPPLSWDIVANRVSQAIYVDGYSLGVTNVSVFGNVAWNTDGIIIGSEKSGLAQDIRVYNNILYDGYFGVNVEPWINNGHTPYFKNVIVVNNIASNNYLNYRTGSDAAGFIDIFYKNNIGVNGLVSLGGSTTQDHNSWNLGITDPMFVDAANHNFRLQSNSPAKDAGSSVMAPSTDYDGKSRPNGEGYDIGAFEN